MFSSDIATGGHFASSVAIDGDTAVCGAYGAGAAYVFIRREEVWLEEARLVPAGGQIGDWIGYSSAICGDTIVIGSVFDDTMGGSTAGSASVFVRSDGVWLQQGHLIASDGGDVDYFGNSVAIDGDTIVSGAYFDDTSDLNTGSVYVFARDAGVWTETAKLVASDAAPDDLFGQSVAIQDDCIAVGAPAVQTTDGEPFRGAVYVFVQRDEEWVEETKLTASDPASLDSFGTSLAIDGNTMIVGAVGNLATVHVFGRSGSGWYHEAELIPSDGEGGDGFAWSADIDADTIVVGAFRDDALGEPEVGSAVVFTRQGDDWSERVRLFASDAEKSDWFGHAVGISGSLIAAGSPTDDVSPGDNVGSAYFFDVSCLTPCPADCTLDGSLDIFDFLCFQALISTQSNGADCDDNGSINIFDFLCFQAQATSCD